MKKTIIACIVSIAFIGCTNSVENSIKKACSQIINETGIKKWKYAIPYITVIEDSISKDWIFYKVFTDVYRNKERSIKCTNLYKIDNIFIVVVGKNSSEKILSAKEFDEIRTFDGDKYHIDAQSFILKINRKNFGYSITKAP